MDEVPADLVRALERAAELEHAVLLQYLFAAASLKRSGDGGVDELDLVRIRGWEATLLGIAREEMAHLAAVSGLLIAVGSVPWLVRPGLPGGRLEAREPALKLERFGPRSLGRFIELEREESQTISGHYAWIRGELVRLDAAGARVVREPPVDRVDGWGISGGARFRQVTDVAAALEVIDAIVGQGAGGEESHLERLLRIAAELARAGFDPARAVAANPALGADAGTSIADPATARVAAAFAAAYQAMALLLDRYYAASQAGSAAAARTRRVAQGLMSGVLRPLGEILTGLPIGASAPGSACGPTYAWDRRIDRTASGAALADMLAAAGASLAGVRPDVPRLVLIGENLRLAARLVGAED